MSATVERSSALRNGRIPNDIAGELPILLELLIHDREVIRALSEYPEGEARNQYAAEALKIGVVALRHVGGMITADQFRRDGDRVLGDLEKALDEHKQTVQVQIESKLKEYFDPKDGRFTDRVQRLVAQDGELSQVIKGFVDGEDSIFAKTLIAHVGRDSALMKVLDPQQSDGLLTALRRNVDEQLASQRN